MDQHSSIHLAAVAIRDYIIAHPLEKRTPSDLIAKFQADRKKLLPAFKKLTGTTVRRFQLEQLMTAASELLLSGMTVKEVAIECGYRYYQNNFTRGFKEFFHAAPEEWLHNKLKQRTDVTPIHS